MKSLAYKILKAEDHRELEAAVQQYIKDGWSLHGSPFTASVHFLAFYQAIVMETDDGDSQDCY